MLFCYDETKEIKKNLEARPNSNPCYFPTQVEVNKDADIIYTLLPRTVDKRTSGDLHNTNCFHLSSILFVDGSDNAMLQQLFQNGAYSMCIKHIEVRTMVGVGSINSRWIFLKNVSSLTVVGGKPTTNCERKPEVLKIVYACYSAGNLVPMGYKKFSILKCSTLPVHNTSYVINPEGRKVRSTCGLNARYHKAKKQLYLVKTNGS